VSDVDSDARVDELFRAASKEAIASTARPRLENYRHRELRDVRVTEFFADADAVRRARARGGDGKGKEGHGATPPPPRSRALPSIDVNVQIDEGALRERLRRDAVSRNAHGERWWTDVVYGADVRWVADADAATRAGGARSLAEAFAEAEDDVRARQLAPVPIQYDRVGAARVDPRGPHHTSRARVSPPGRVPPSRSIPTRLDASRLPPPLTPSNAAPTCLSLAQKHPETRDEGRGRERGRRDGVEAFVVAAALAPAVLCLLHMFLP
jgi:hypothetical protein